MYVYIYMHLNIHIYVPLPTSISLIDIHLCHPMSMSICVSTAISMSIYHDASILYTPLVFPKKLDLCFRQQQPCGEQQPAVQTRPCRRWKIRLLDWSTKVKVVWLSYDYLIISEAHSNYIMPNTTSTLEFIQFGIMLSPGDVEKKSPQPRWWLQRIVANTMEIGPSLQTGDSKIRHASKQPRNLWEWYQLALRLWLSYSKLCIKNAYKCYKESHLQITLSNIQINRENKPDYYPTIIFYFGRHQWIEFSNIPILNLLKLLISSCFSRKLTLTAPSSQTTLAAWPSATLERHAARSLGKLVIRILNQLVRCFLK